MGDNETLLYELTEGGKLCNLTLNRPTRLNAFTKKMQDELISSVARADADPNVRVILLSGAGKAFCAGADLGKGASTFDAEANSNAPAGSLLGAHRDGGGKVSLAFNKCRKPIIVAMHGSAVGVGITMSLAADLRVAAEDTKIGFVFASRGIVPEACSTFFLSRLVGAAKAAEYIYTARVFTAKDAANDGLFNYVVKKDEVKEKALQLAKEIIERTSGISVCLAKALLQSGTEGNATPESQHLLESKCMYWAGQADDVKEGIVSFLQKRKANFTTPVDEKHLPSFYPWRSSL